MANMRDLIEDMCCFIEEDIIFVEEHDHAIIGHCYDPRGRMKIVYNKEMCDPSVIIYTDDETSPLFIILLPEGIENKVNAVIDAIPNDEEKLTFLDDIGGAIIGYTFRGEKMVVVYDYKKIVEQFESEGMDFEEAVDHIEYNIVRSLPYCYQNAPLVIDLICMEDI